MVLAAAMATRALIDDGMRPLTLISVTRRRGGLVAEKNRSADTAAEWLRGTPRSRGTTTGPAAFFERYRPASAMRNSSTSLRHEWDALPSSDS